MNKKNLRHFDRERLIWDAQIEAKHKLILLAYNSFLGANDICWPSNPVIAAMTGIPKSTLIRDLQEMRQRQLVVSNPRFLKNKRRSPDKPLPTKKPQTSNETVINWNLLESLAKKTPKSAQSQNETTPQSQNETTPQSQNETTPVPNRDYPQSQNETRSNSYGSNSGSNSSFDLIHKDPLNPPEGDRGIANASKSEEGEQEPIAHEPKLPEQNTTLDKNSSPVKDQSSAPRRRSPSKAVEAIKRQYSELPGWRTGWGIGEYCEGFKDYVQRTFIDKLPANSVWASYTPTQILEDSEAMGKFASLEERCKGWQQQSQAKRQAAEAALAAQTIAAAQPEEPREMPMDAIARIMQAQGLTPADVLPEVKSEYRAVFNRLPSDPQEAWDLLSRAQLSIIATFLEKKYAPTSTP